MFADTTLPSAASGIRLRDRLGSVLAALRAYNKAKQDQVRLSHMSDRMLRDVGLTRGDKRHIGRSPY